MSIEKKGKRVFITGATGYIGSVVTEYAVKEGYDVYGLSRDENKDEKLTKLGATVVRGDLYSHDILKEQSAKADIVFHFAYIHDFSGKIPISEVLKVDADAINALAEGLVGTGKPLLFASGAAMVSPDPKRKETDENAEPNQWAAATRLKSETNAFTWTSKDVRVIAIRLAPFVYGRGGGKGFVFLQMADAAANGVARYIGDGSVYTSEVHVDDAAKLCLLAAEKGEAGDIFNCTSKTTLTYKEIAEGISKVVKVPTKSVTVEELTESFRVFLVTLFQTDVRASSRKAREKLGWKPTEPDLLTDLTEGSYVPVAEELKKSIPSA